MAKDKAGLVPPSASRQEPLLDFVKAAMKLYGEEVNTDRAVVDYRDGLKPVARRLIWSAYAIARVRPVKAARIVGDTMGRYHPHGDCLRGDTLVYTLDGKFTPISQMVEKGKKWVLSFDEKRKRYVPALAHAWRIGQATKRMMRVHLSDGSSIECTGNHPFLIRGAGWIRARDLKEDMEVRSLELRLDKYLNVASADLPRVPVHTLVSSHFMKREDHEITHHENEIHWDNRPKNLSIIDRAEHQQAHIDNALVGLDNGRERMFGVADKNMREAIRRKNSALMRSHNHWLWLIKAIKIAKKVSEANLELNEESYKTFSHGTHNPTKPTTLFDRGITWKVLASYVDNWSMPVTEAVGHTRNLPKAKKVKVLTRKPSTPDPAKRRFGLLVRFALKYEKLSTLSFEKLDFYRTMLIKRTARKYGRQSAGAPTYTLPTKRVYSTYGRSVKDALRKIGPIAGIYIVQVEQVILDSTESFYDFTVDGYQNMMVASQVKKDRVTLVCLHNSALFGALVTQVNAEVHTFNGDGNWGTLIDPPAAMRYPEAALSEYGRSFLHPHYRPVMDMVSNYDKREKEPLCLPSLFPNVLMNSTIGIGVGTSAAIPSFTPPSLLKVMVRLLDGEKLTASDYAKSLEFFDPWGAKAVKSKANAASIKAFITSSKGSVTWTAPLKVDREKKRITMEAFAPNTRIETIPAKAPKKPKPGLIDRIRLLPERPDVFSVNGGLGYVIQAKRTLNYPEFDKLVSTIERMLTKPVKYEINVTERNPSPGPEEYKTAFFALSVEKLIQKWLVYRIQLEKKSLVERVRVQKEHIDYTKLLIYAADKLDVIFKGLRTSDPDSFLVKHLRITPEQAKQILALRVRQLSKLDQDQLKLKLVELQKLLKDLERRTRSPKKEVRDFLDRCSSLFKLERSKMGHWHWVLTKIDNVKDTEVEAVSQEA